MLVVCQRGKIWAGRGARARLIVPQARILVLRIWTGKVLTRVELRKNRTSCSTTFSLVQDVGNVVANPCFCFPVLELFKDSPIYSPKHTSSSLVLLTVVVRISYVWFIFFSRPLTFDDWELRSFGHFRFLPAVVGCWASYNLFGSRFSFRLRY